MIPGQEELRKLSDEAAAHVLSMEGTQSGTRTGWLMITTILLAVVLAGDRMAGSPRGPRIDLPPLVLWAWDRDDDLQFVDTRDTAVR